VTFEAKDFAEATKNVLTMFCRNRRSYIKKRLKTLNHIQFTGKKNFRMVTNGSIVV
jgi:hypothetical protein